MAPTPHTTRQPVPPRTFRQVLHHTCPSCLPSARCHPAAAAAHRLCCRMAAVLLWPRCVLIAVVHPTEAPARAGLRSHQVHLETRRVRGKCTWKKEAWGASAPRNKKSGGQMHLETRRVGGKSQRRAGPRIIHWSGPYHADLVRVGTNWYMRSCEEGKGGAHKPQWSLFRIRRHAERAVGGGTGMDVPNLVW